MTCKVSPPFFVFRRFRVGRWCFSYLMGSVTPLTLSWARPPMSYLTGTLTSGGVLARKGVTNGHVVLALGPIVRGDSNSGVTSLTSGTRTTDGGVGSCYGPVLSDSSCLVFSLPLSVT